MSLPRADAKMDDLTKKRAARDAFTLIELLVVITIIAILMGLLFPAFKGVQDQAKRTQAKNDITQVVTALNAFYTEYGKYPCDAQTGADAQDFFTADDDTNNKTFDILRGDPANGWVQTYNPKAIAFMQPLIAKDLGKPRSGIGGNGRLYDPWGNVYRLRIDNNYNGMLENPYSTNAGFNPIQQGVLAWSIGKDADGAKNGSGGGDKKTGTFDDDVISWQ